MKRTLPNLLLIALLSALALGLNPDLTSNNAPNRQPNVLLIMTDDQGWGDLSLHGNPDLQTPNLDQLARSGAQFERFYVSPVCAPTRASLLTGRYHLRTGTITVTGGWEAMRPDETTIAELFRANGYRTGCFGKWHNGEHYPQTPQGQGFDQFTGFLGGHLNNYFDATLEQNGQLRPTKGFITDVLTDAALGFIRAKSDKPFFCYVPYNAPHSPFQVSDAYFKPFKDKGLTDELASVYGMVKNVDDNVGRLLKQLEKQGIANNTIVVFLTDNGPNGVRYNGHMRGIKAQVDEGGIRVPCFVRWPGHIQPNTVVNTPAAHIDLLPTLAGLCTLPNTKTTHPLDGQNLSEILLGRIKSGPAWINPSWIGPARMLFTHQAVQPFPALQPMPGAVRAGQYVWINRKNAPELYDLQADPEQKTDLVQTHPSLTDSLGKAYQRWFEQMQAEAKTSHPIPVGYAEARQVTLPGIEAHFVGKVRFNEGHGWANDWLTGWQTTTDTIQWQVDVQKPGTYQVMLQYACPLSGAVFNLLLDNKVVMESQSLPAFVGLLLPSPDRVPRKEAYGRVWGNH
ncbi:MAG: sulfatase-like hydrolase/transferase, partial [Rudanella sp.]|nr:sulfatase-like hydrolase/transferase [Rudanella sp.]